MMRTTWIARVRSSMANRRHAARLALMRTPVAQRRYDRAKCRNCFPKMAAPLALPTLDSALFLAYCALSRSMKEAAARVRRADLLRGNCEGRWTVVSDGTSEGYRNCCRG